MKGWGGWSPLKQQKKEKSIVAVDKDETISSEGFEDKVSPEEPKIKFEELSHPDAVGQYIPESNTIKMHPKYKTKSLLSILKNPKKHKEMAIERGETYRHEKKHHEQFQDLGVKKYNERYNREHMEQLEKHMDPFVHNPEHRQLKDYEVHPEVKTAKKYESINPALAEITANRYSDWWKRVGQYITPGTLEYEAEEAAFKKNK